MASGHSWQVLRGAAGEDDDDAPLSSSSSSVPTVLPAGAARPGLLAGLLRRDVRRDVRRRSDPQLPAARELRVGAGGEVEAAGTARTVAELVDGDGDAAGAGVHAEIGSAS